MSAVLEKNRYFQGLSCVERPCYFQCTVCRLFVWLWLYDRLIRYNDRNMNERKNSRSLQFISDLFSMFALERFVSCHL